MRDMPVGVNALHMFLKEGEEEEVEDNLSAMGLELDEEEEKRLRQAANAAVERATEHTPMDIYKRFLNFVLIKSACDPFLEEQYSKYLSHCKKKAREDGQKIRKNFYA